MTSFLKIIAFIYLLFGIASLLMVPAGLYEWFGIEQDPLSGVFALLLALPWTLSLNLFKETSTYFSLMVSAIGIAINSAFLFWLARPGSK